MSDQYERREFLKWIGSALVSLLLLPLALTGCGGDGDEQELASSGDEPSVDDSAPPVESSTTEDKTTHQVPHPDDTSLPESETTGQALGGAERSPVGTSPKDNPSVMLQHEPNGDQYCGNCTMFVPDQDGDGFGACTMVEGKIHTCDFCNLYVRHSGEGSIPCTGA